MLVPGNMGQKGTGAGLDHNVIPMINVVFLILMFFLVAGHLQDIDATGIDIPLSNAVQPIRGNDETIILTQSGKITWRGKQMQMEALKVIADRTDMSLSEKVIVLTDAGTRSATVLELIMMLKRNGVGRISLVTVEKSEISAASF